ncbi:MAG: hypothetical protein U0271_39840 [Polyangiaceae bacterium]
MRSAGEHADLRWALLFCVCSVASCGNEGPSATNTKGSSQQAQSRNLGAYAYVSALPEQLTKVIPAPIRLVRVELASGRAKVTALSPQNEPVQYTFADDALTGPAPLEKAAPTNPEDTFTVDDVDWGAIPQKAQAQGLAAGIDVENTVEKISIVKNPKGSGALLEMRVSASRPRGYEDRTSPAK